MQRIRFFIPDTVCHEGSSGIIVSIAAGQAEGTPTPRQKAPPAGDADDEFSYNQYWRLPMRHDVSDSDSDDADTFEGTDGNASDATAKTV